MVVATSLRSWRGGEQGDTTVSLLAERSLSFSVARPCRSVVASPVRRSRVRLHGLGFFRLRGDVARAGKRRLHRFAGAGCSAPKLAELIRSSNSVQWTASSVPRLQLQRLACQSEVSQSAALRLEALWSDETGDGESGDALACQCGFRPLGIVGAGLWKRASQLAERPLARAHPVEIPSGVLARFAGGRHRVGSPTQCFVPWDEFLGSAETTTPFVRGPGPRLRANSGGSSEPRCSSRSEAQQPVRR